MVNVPFIIFYEKLFLIILNCNTRKKYIKHFKISLSFFFYKFFRWLKKDCLKLKGELAKFLVFKGLLINLINFRKKQLDPSILYRILNFVVLISNIEN